MIEFVKTVQSVEDVISCQHCKELIKNGEDIWQDTDGDYICDSCKDFSS